MGENCKREGAKFSRPREQPASDWSKVLINSLIGRALAIERFYWIILIPIWEIPNMGRKL